LPNMSCWSHFKNIFDSCCIRTKFILFIWKYRKVFVFKEFSFFNKLSHILSTVTRSTLLFIFEEIWTWARNFISTPQKENLFSKILFFRKKYSSLFHIYHLFEREEDEMKNKVINFKQIVSPSTVIANFQIPKKKF